MNNDSGISGSLTRKLGPLPVWAWAILAGVIIYYMRNRGGATSGPSSSQLAAAQTAAADQTPQAPVVLAPGETVYDPNSGNLLGGSSNSGNNTGNGVLGLIAALASIEHPPPAHKHKHKKRPPRKHHHHMGMRGGRTHPFGGRARNFNAHQHNVGGRKWGRPHGHPDPAAGKGHK